MRGRRARRSRSSSGRGCAIWLAALFALLTLEPMRNPKAGRWDDPPLTHDLGAVTDVWARWDAVHFLRIAEHGYSTAEAAFYPLYPGLVAGSAAARSAATTCSRGVARLAARDARRVRAPRAARGGAARRGRRRGGPCSTSRSSRRRSSSRRCTRSRSSSCSALGRVRRSPSAAAFAERGRRRRARRAHAADRPRARAAADPASRGGVRGGSRRRCRSLAVVSAASLARRRRPVGVRARRRDLAPAPLARRAARRDLGRRCAPDGPASQQLASGSNAHVYWTAVSAADSAPLRTAVLNLELFGFLALFVALTVVAWRRVRRAVRPLRGAEPRAAAERSELALAAPLAAALRARRLPVLPRARLARRPSRRARTRRSSAVSATAARRLRHAVGALGLGRVETRRQYPRADAPARVVLVFVAAAHGRELGRRACRQATPDPNVRLPVGHRRRGGAIQFVVMLA